MGEGRHFLAGAVGLPVSPWVLDMSARGSDALLRADAAGAAACGSSVGIAIVNLGCPQDCPVKVGIAGFYRLLRGHRHHIAVEVGDDPD